MGALPDQPLPVTETVDLVASLGAALRPPPQLTVSEWADRYRVLTTDGGATARGRWRTSKTEYLREIMDVLSPGHSAKKVIFWKPSRIGGTELALNTIGCWIDIAPSPILAIQPRVEDGEGWSRENFDTMVDACPRLREKVAKPMSRVGSNTLTHKRFLGGRLWSRGANSAAGFRRITARLVIGDEIDGWPAVVGDSSGGGRRSEGDPGKLAETRARTYKHTKKIFFFSTCTVRGLSRIEKEYELSDQRKLWLPCPHCGSYQQLRWGQVRYQRTDGGHVSDAYYECEDCSERIDEHHKPWMIERCEWIAENPESEIPGFWMNALCSPWLTWIEAAQEWVEAQGDPSKLQVFVNHVLAETWDDSEGSKVEPGSAASRIQVWWSPEPDADPPVVGVPADVAFLTAGVDTQDDRFEGVVYGWGPDKKGYLVDRWAIYGDTKADETYRDLEEMLYKTYAHEGLADGLPIAAAGIDSGGHSTDEVYAFAKKHVRERWWAFKGQAGENHPIFPHREKRTKSKVRRTHFNIGVDGAKAWVYAKLLDDEFGLWFPGYIDAAGEILPAPFCDEAFFRQLTIERRRIKYTTGGQPVRWWYKPPHEANESLDCSVYSVAAMLGLVAQGWKVDNGPRQLRRRRSRAEVFEEAAAKPDAKSPRRGRGPARRVRGTRR